MDCQVGLTKDVVPTDLQDYIDVVAEVYGDDGDISYQVFMETHGRVDLEQLVLHINDILGRAYELTAENYINWYYEPWEREA